MSKKLFKGLHLHTKFIVLLISVSLIPLIIVGAVTLTLFQHTLESDASKLGHQLAATASAEAKSFMVSQLRILDNIAALYQPEFPIESDTAARVLENILFRSDNFSDLSVVNSSGREIARKNRILAITNKELRDRGESAEFRAVRDAGTYIGPVAVRNSRPYFVFGIQILDSRGAFAGAVFADVDARILPKVVADISKNVGSSGRVYIINDKGIVIGHPDISYVLSEKDLSVLPPVRSVIENPLQIGVSARYINEQGLEVLGAAHPVSVELFDARSKNLLHINWYVVAEQPVSAVYRGAREATIFSVLFSLLAVILAGLAALFFAGRISRPIESLHIAAQQFGQGNLNHRAPIESGDEIGDLATSFNSMDETIGKAMLSLKHEEEIIPAERNKLSLILSGITNAVIAVDPEGTIVLFNRAAESLTGKNSLNILGGKIQDAIKISDGTREVPFSEYCPPHQGSQGGLVYRKNDLKITDAGGKEHIVHLVSSRNREGLHVHLGYILMFQDITSEFAMERTKREFVSIAAHQLRTPLTGMKWAVDYLLAGEKGELQPVQKELALQALDATDHMIHLVDDLLDVARVEDGRFDIEPSVQSIAPILDRAMKLFSAEAAKKGVDVILDIQKDIPKLNIDAAKMEIVFNNVLDNAVKYTPTGGSIAVSLARASGAVRFSVGDTGIGIPQNESDRIFTKFFRSSQASARHTDGSGLGLFISKKIIDLHKGSISFESKKEGGTRFIVTLPLVA